MKPMQTYYSGELLAGIVLVCSGMLLALLTVYLFQAQSIFDIAKGLRWPFLVLSLMATLGGGLTAYQNQQRLDKLPAQCKPDPGAFIKTETERMHRVNQGWTPLNLTYTLLIVGGLAGFWLTNVPVRKGIWLGVVLVGVTGLFIEGFAQERARQYTDWLLQQAAD